MEQNQIYLDNSATTKICREALNVYNRVSEETFGNPSSLHSLGQRAEREVECARKRILSSVGMKCGNAVFTASGSEANNLAILGRAFAKDRYKHGKIITTAGEHSSVSEPLARLEREGYKVAYIPTKDGLIDFDVLSAELTSDVFLVTVMMVNNETGAVYDIPRVAKIVRSRCKDALIHIDATQGYMKIPFTKAGLGADMITVSSHKIEGPKGVGALVFGSEIVKARGLSPIIFGGGQEMGYRPGTENVPGIAAFGEAVRIASERMVSNIEKMTSLREYLLEKLVESKELCQISPTLPKNHAPHILNITLPNIKSETMLHFLSSKGIYVSSGSACSSNTTRVSSALTAFGRSESEADCSIRISFSPRNTKEDVDILTDALCEGLSSLARIRR